MRPIQCLWLRMKPVYTFSPRPLSFGINAANLLSSELIKEEKILFLRFPELYVSSFQSEFRQKVGGLPLEENRAFPSCNSLAIYFDAIALDSFWSVVRDRLNTDWVIIRLSCLFHIFIK